MIKTTTLKDLLNTSVEQYPNRPVLYKSFDKYDTYEELKNKIISLMAGMLEYKLQGKNIAIIGSNSYEWALSFLTVSCGLGISIPLDKELTIEELNNTLKQIKIDCIIYSDDMNQKIADIKKSYKDILYISMNKKEKINIYDLLEKGKKKFSTGNTFFNDLVVKEDDLVAYIFTSGTSEKSKIIMLSQKNLATNAYGAAELFELKVTDKFFSVLPIHHTYEIVSSILVPMTSGASACFNSGIKNFKKDINLNQPTIIMAVPRILEFICSSIEKEIKKQNKEKIINMLINISNFFLKFKINLKKLFFKPIHKNLGGKIRMLGCGAASLDVDVLNKLADFGYSVHQGYGLSECSPIVTTRGIHYKDADSVGVPIAGTEIKIINKDKSDIGEIIVKGDQVMLGYYNNDFLNKQVIKNGWFHTGDLGYIKPSGCLKIVGRTKNIILSSNGKNIYPEEIEALIVNSPYIKEAIVKGKKNNNKLLVIAHIVLEPDYCNDSSIEKKITSFIADINSTLPSYKHINKFIIEKEEFPKTTTLKIKRW
ncbi:MAG: AMP-binding protein [Bacilli bacterium]|nr:AMP-binding protein [Bacilli bacterium]MDD4809223.1 AMP-binding protein [Bacilli bacterium]